jgi:Copper type II ascorbate-dependent monooxygenase, N-terminal domain/Copper type II ascorbate-dependent monooxygenase, C-terminal domain
MRQSSALAVVSLAVCVLACSPKSSAPEPSGLSLPCDVNAVLASSCRTCHGPSPAFGAPMSLVTFDDLHAADKTDPSRKVYELVATRTHDAVHPMPQPPNARLDETSQGVVDAWIAAGAPGTLTACPPPPPPSDAAAPDIQCTPDVHLAPRGTYPLSPDQANLYVCYGVDLTVDAKRHLTAFGPRVDNVQIVHHMLLFQSDTPLDPTPAPCGVIQSTNWRIAGGWAPGGHGFELPPEAGFPIEGTSHFIVQVHYNNALRTATSTDASGFDLCTTPTLRPNDADILAFGTISIKIPPHAGLDLTCNYTLPTDMHVFGALPHMHKIGTYQASARVVPGGVEGLGEANPFSFEGQSWQKIDRSLTRGDVVRTRCAWNNPSDVTVQFGENTEDEMCFGFEMYYPRITSSRWKWVEPSVASDCAPTPQ